MINFSIKELIILESLIKNIKTIISLREDSIERGEVFAPQDILVPCN